MMSFTNSSVVMVQSFGNSAKRNLDVIFRMYKPCAKAKVTKDKEFGVLCTIFSLAGVWLYLKSCVNVRNSLLGTRDSSGLWCLCLLSEGCWEFSQTWNPVGSVFAQRLEILTSSPHSSTICHLIANQLVRCQWRRDKLNY